MPAEGERARIVRLREACARLPHGERARYISGCRCLQCRAANSRYECERRRARLRGESNGLVDAAPARAHLNRLARCGVGLRSVAAASDVAKTTLHEIAAGKKTRIRAVTARKVLAVDRGAMGGGAKIPGARTWRMIGELLERGYPRGQIARWLGAKTPKLHIQRGHVTAATEVKVARLYALINQGKVKRK